MAEPPVILWNLVGNFTDCPEAYEFLREFREQMGSGTEAVLVDLSQLDHMSSCGAGILAACLASASNAARRLVFSGLSRRSDSILTVVGLRKVMQIYPTQEAAVQALRT